MNNFFIITLALTLSFLATAKMNKNKEWDPDAEQDRALAEQERACERNARDFKTCQANLKRALTGCTRVQDEIVCGDELFKKVVPVMDVKNK